MTHPVNVQTARPGSHNHAPTSLEIQRWEDDGGAIHPDERRPTMSLVNLFVTVRDALIEGRRQRCVYDDLMALDDRLLADIGMHRSRIPAIVEAMSVYEGTALCPAARSRPALRLVAGHR